MVLLAVTGLLNGCFGPEQPTVNPAVKKFRRAVEAHNTIQQKINMRWDANVAREEFTLEQKKAGLVDLLSLARSMDPSAPRGVDPDLVQAISNLKDAQVAFFTAMVEDCDRDPSDQKHAPWGVC